jgi:hypothetical protein
MGHLFLLGEAVATSVNPGAIKGNPLPIVQCIPMLLRVNTLQLP